MTLEFRETKRPYGRKKILEIEVISDRLVRPMVVGVIRPELNEFEPRAFEKFSAADVARILQVMAKAHGLDLLAISTFERTPDNANAHKKRANTAHARTKSRAKRKANR